MYGTCACAYLVLFGLSKWLFMMNYFSLACKLKYSEQEFDAALPWINAIYYSFSALNILLPILGVVLYQWVSQTVGYWLLISFAILSLLTVFV